MKVYHLIVLSLLLYLLVLPKFCYFLSDAAIKNYFNVCVLILKLKLES